MGFWSHRATHERAWHWLFETLKPDIALCQECVPPHWARKDWTIFWDQAAPDSKQPWGTALLTRLLAKSARLPELDLWLAQLPDRVPGKDELAGIHKADGWLATAEINIPFIGPTLSFRYITHFSLLSVNGLKVSTSLLLSSRRTKTSGSLTFFSTFYESVLKTI